MKKTVLEGLLEEGFAQRGIKFFPRITGKEIIDKIGESPQGFAGLERVAARDHGKEFQFGQVERLLANPLEELSFTVNLTDEEDYVQDEDIPLFVRKSAYHGGVSLKYEVFPLGRVDIHITSEEEVESRVRSQGIWILGNKGVAMAYLMANRTLATEPYQVEVAKDMPAFMPESHRENISRLIRQFEDSSTAGFSPERVYRAIMAFLDSSLQ